MLGPRCAPGSFPAGDASNAAALPGGAEPFPAALPPFPWAAGPLPSIPWSLLRAMKPNRNPSRTCWCLVPSARRCLTQLLKLCFRLFFRALQSLLQAYAKFSGAPLTVTTINKSWRALKGDLPVLSSEDIVISQPAKILNFLRKQKYNADYDLSAKQGADTLAYIALLEEKLLPALLHTFWIEAENYCSVTKPWFASRIAFPLNLYLPGKMSREALNRILLTKGGPPLYSLTEVEAQIYRDAKECLNLLSKRLGTSQFFFGDTPTTLDAFVFGFLAPIYKVCFPRVHLQEHLKQLPNLCRFCDDILTCYFRLTVSDPALIVSLQMDDNLRKSPHHPPRKLTTLKLAAGGEESSPMSRLSP